MRLIHEIQDIVNERFLVFNNPKQRLPLREELADGYRYLQTMEMMYDGMGHLWVPITLEGHVGEYLIVMNRYHGKRPEFCEWEKGQFMLVPIFNYELYVVDNGFSLMEKQIKIEKWHDNSQKLALDWIESATKTPLEDFNYHEQQIAQEKKA